MSNKLAVFVCGSGGSGKTTFVNRHFPAFNQVNVDIPYEELLLSSGLGLRIDTFDSNDLRKALEFFEIAKDISYKTFLESIERGEDIVIDSVGRYSDYVFQQRKQLELSGYNTIMFMLYAPLDVCIERVNARDRVYDKYITEESWYLSYGNIAGFKKEFLDDFYLIFNGENTVWEQKIQQLVEKKKLSINRKDKYL